MADYKSACDRIAWALERTSWGMLPDWREALRLERSPSHCGNLSDARRICAKEWLAGFEAPQTSAVEVYMRRPGARLAFLLGAECSTRMGGMAGALLIEAQAACRLAMRIEESIA